MATPDIDLLSLILCALLVLVPLAVAKHLKLGIIRKSLLALIRMAVQLGMVGFFLRYVFAWDNFFLTSGWLLVMIVFAAFTVTKSTSLRIRSFFFPVFISIAATTLFVLFYFNLAVLDTADLLEARYAIAIGGMLLGNSLKGAIIGLQHFYDGVQREHNCYSYHLGLGASRMEALRPYLQSAFKTALLPVIATMATMGLVFLPGMMTGQILGGTAPVLAIKYQIAIMLAIFSCTTIAVGVSIILTARTAFDDYGMLHPEKVRVE
ncbi:MAG: ABC transporter permease [Lentisphaeria bacterium]